MANADFDAFLADLSRRHAWLPAPLAQHYARLYGTRADRVIDGATEIGGLGRHFGGLLHEREITYLRDAEWAFTAEDILDRRTKHGLHLTLAQRNAVKTYMGG